MESVPGNEFAQSLSSTAPSRSLVQSGIGICAGQFSLSDATTAEVMVAARKLSVASAKAAAEIYASVRSSFEEAFSSVPQLLQGIPFLPSR